MLVGRRFVARTKEERLRFETLERERPGKPRAIERGTLVVEDVELVEHLGPRGLDECLRRREPRCQRGCAVGKDDAPRSIFDGDAVADSIEDDFELPAECSEALLAVAC